MRKQKYPNGIGPNWMDRYIDPLTGKKKVWNYKPKKSPSRNQRVGGDFEHSATCTCKLTRACKLQNEQAQQPFEYKEAA